MVRPSTQPSSRSRPTKAAVQGLKTDAFAPMNPIVGTLSDACGYAASGHAVADPTIAIKKLRRRIAFSKALECADYRSQRILQQGSAILKIDSPDGTLFRVLDLNQIQSSLPGLTVAPLRFG